MKLFTIPNVITLLNLACGCLAIVFAFNFRLDYAAYLVGIAAILDFLDGFVARALKQFSPIGKDLDSLADMVTFGVVPGVVMFHLIGQACDDGHLGTWGLNIFDMYNYPIAYVAFLIPLFSALRLAKFNNDTRQSESFIGVPTPANSILICSFALIQVDILRRALIYSPERTSTNLSPLERAFMSGLENEWILAAIVVVMSILLIAELPLFALKFKSFKWKGNQIRYSFLAACVVMLVLLKYIALPLIILLYILLSIVNNVLARKTQIGKS